MNNKAQQMTLGKIILIVLGITVLILLISGFSNGWENTYCSIFDCKEMTVTSETCSDSSMLKIGLDEYDREVVKGIVVDYYIDEKELSETYWDRICEDLLEEELREELNKSKNIRLSAGGQYTENSKQLYCEFNMFWTGEGESYMDDLDYGFRYFNLVDILPAKEKRPAEYNESLVFIEVREDFRDSVIKNENRDYYVKVNVFLNESEWRCY